MEQLTTVSDLPEEILARIFHHLHDSESLTSVALAARQYYRIARPLFYRTIRVHMLGSSPLDSILPDRNRWPRLYGLLYAHQELRTAVQHLHLIYPRHLDHSPTFKQREELYRLIESLIGLKTLFIQGPLSYACRALNVPRTSEAPNAGYLTFEDIFASEALCAFRLETFVWQQHCRISKQAVVTLTSHQSWARLPKFTNVTNLRLYGVRAEEHGFMPVFVPQLLRATQCLTTFHLELSTTDSLQLSQIDDSLFDALELHERTLEELLFCSSDNTSISAQGFPWPKMSHVRLEKFNSLKRLAIPEDWICRCPVRGCDQGSLIAESGLPPNIEFLQLQYSMFGPHRQDRRRVRREHNLELLVETAPEIFPHLKTIVCWIQQKAADAGWTYGYGPRLDELEHSPGEEKPPNEPDFQWISTPWARETPFLKHQAVRPALWPQ